MFDYSDLDSCIEALNNVKAAYYVKTIEGGSELVCYEPYGTYDYNSDKLNVHCYVYLWKDVYDKNGKFIRHIPFEGLYLSELDKTI